MNSNLYSNHDYHDAEKVVNKKIGFYVHLFVYMVINLFFHVINYIQGGYYWACWPLIGWGIGLLFHALGVFGPIGSASWKRKMIQKELERQHKF